MKRLLLMGVAVAMLSMGANAQLLRRSDQARPTKFKMDLPKPTTTITPFKCEVVEMHPAVPGQTVTQAPKRADGTLKARYRRPAGAFPGSLIEADMGGSIVQVMTPMPVLFVTAYENYTFTDMSENVSDAAQYSWRVQSMDNDGEQEWNEFDDEKSFTWAYDLEVDSVPQLTVTDGDATDTYFLHGYQMEGDESNPVKGDMQSALISGYPESEYMWDEYFTMLRGATSFAGGGHEGTSYNPMTSVTGATPYGNNENGWWFGKNGEGIDGIAQGFEKPTVSYLLKNVWLKTGALDVNAATTLTCKIWKMTDDGFDEYQNETPVTLDAEFGELIATGKAELTPGMDTVSGDLICFKLYDTAENETELTIENAILITIEGYNENEAITDITAMISTDIDCDEGFGETAYLKTAEGVWTGLNNYFDGYPMKTAFSIFLDIENPFLTFNYTAEDGKYTFDEDGGLMRKTMYETEDTTMYTESIELYSWVPSADGGMWVTCDDDADMSWLTIELEDVMDSDEDEEEEEDFFGIVNVKVTADSLPDGVDARDVVVYFTIPGKKLAYHFYQVRGAGVEELGITEGQVIAVDYYDLMGRRLSAPTQGFYLERQTFDNGQVRTKKIRR